MEPDGLTGRRIAEARGDARLSQRALAVELGVSVRTIQNYEAGRFVPYRHLDALSRLLHRPSSWLLYGLDQPEGDRLVLRLRQQRELLDRNLERLAALRDELLERGRTLTSG
jgi:transcriptional regulator with XRE-family HTH domain